MKGILLTLLTLLLPAIGTHAQELVVKSFTQSQLELIRSQDRRTDGNGQPCALVKVQLTDDQIERLEGGYVGEVSDHGSEAWTYWTEGTKYIKVYFKHHLPVTVRIPDYEISSLEGNMVYVLVLFAPAEDKKFHIGLRGGMNYSFPSMDKNTGDNFGNIVSFHVGPAIDYRLHQNFALQGALLFSGKGFTNDNHFDDYDMHANAYYLDIPIEAAYIPVNTDNLQLRIFAGPYVAIGLTGTIKDERYHDFDYSFFDKYNNFDYGLSAGVGLMFARHITVSAGYQHGFDSKYKNRCLTASVGYMF